MSDLVERDAVIKAIACHVSHYDDHYMHCLTRCIPEEIIKLPTFVTPSDEVAQRAWLPIETAPKDKTRVLLWAGTWRHPFVGYASNTPYMAYLDIPTPTATEIEVFATHWMLLLDPPRVSATDVEQGTCTEHEK